MDDVTSFKIDHNKLLRGVYVSRKDPVGSETVTTFDIRMKEPNREPVMDTATMHTLEHLMAVYIRGGSSGWAGRMLYIGPMGCRTGMYLIAKGSLESGDILHMLIECFKYILNFKGPVPYTDLSECGNALDHNLFFAQYESRKFLNEVLLDIRPENLKYPD
ncbi:MAG: S-ribosylhomocysteine lyase [Clostridiales bacterium]|jgi:S-ribosylhomocysteine lyase|nr:S-ribosylhomocysteine lyase [Clostridiales bacterium]